MVIQTPLIDVIISSSLLLIHVPLYLLFWFVLRIYQFSACSLQVIDESDA